MTIKETILFIIITITSIFFIKWGESFGGSELKIKKCAQNQDPKCFVNVVEMEFDKNGLDHALDLVYLTYQRNPIFSAVCHDVGHILGTKTYKVFEEGGEFKINPKSSFCSYGFYHGFMENLAADGNTKKAKDFCKMVDAQIAKETPDATLQCFHGIGHGWVNIHDDKSLWGDEMAIAKRSLSLCKEVSETDLELSRCATGVFNGIAVFYTTGEYEFKLKNNDPLWLCKAQPQEFQNACFISMNIVLLSISGGDLKKASLHLTGIKNKEMASHAMINLALPYGLSKIGSEDNKESIETCRSLVETLRIPCLQGVAFSFLEHGEPGVEYIKSINFCRDHFLSEEETKSCLSYIYGYLPQWYKQEKAFKICDDEGSYKDYCYETMNRFLP